MLNMSDQLKEWMGTFGDEYTERNMPDEKNIMQRMYFWTNNFAAVPSPPKEIFEIGSNVGANLLAIDNIFKGSQENVELLYNEPNEKANKIIQQQNIRSLRKIGGDLGCLECDSGIADLVFTCGVLIHIHPDDLYTAMREIYRTSRKYIICSEYFSPHLREIIYRDKKEMLWARDFGSEWLDKFNGLRCVGYNFAWKRITGMDNLTTWIFEKAN